MEYIIGKELYKKYKKFSFAEKVLSNICVGYLLVYIISLFI